MHKILFDQLVAPPNKLARAISSSASAVSSLLRKAELLGVNTVSISFYFNWNKTDNYSFFPGDYL